MTDEKIGHRDMAIDQRFLAQWPVGISMDTVRVCAMHDEPLGAFEMIVSDRVAKQIIKHAKRHLTAKLFRNRAPVLCQPALLGLRPEKLQPGGVVACDRGVVERLRIEGIGAAALSAVRRGPKPADAVACRLHLHR